MREAYSQGLCVHVWICHHAGIIKVIDLPCSIMRAGAATVTFGRKCHSTLNDDSDDRPYFGGHFSNMDTLFSQKPGRDRLTQQNREQGAGGGGGFGGPGWAAMTTGWRGEATVVVGGSGKRTSRGSQVKFCRDDQESLGRCENGFSAKKNPCAALE